MPIKEELIKIIGADNVFTDPEVLKRYSCDYSLNPHHMPHYVARPKDTGEVQKIVLLANEKQIPIVPCSSGVHFNGNTIPILGGIIIDLQRMNNILDINTNNKMVRVESGVQWSQLQKELKKYNMMALCPLFPHPMKSVVASHLEREPMLIPKFEYTGSLVTLEMVLPDGEVFRTGSACVPGFPDKSMAEGVNPGGPGDISWHWLVQGAQGTMGIVTWAQIKMAPRPKINKTIFMQFEHLEDALQLTYNVQKRMLGEECFIMNSSNLASMLSRTWPEDYRNLEHSLKPWVMVFILGGGWRLPEGKIEYEEQGLNEALTELNMDNKPVSLAALPGIENDLPDMLRTAWPENRTYWKFANKGACQELFFHTTLDKTPEFVQLINKTAVKHGYNETGYYIQPLEYGRACHFECDFYYNPNKTEEIDMIRNIFSESAECVMESGGFITRPYGVLADMVYSRAPEYASALKKVKNMLDPNNVMSPGRLGF